MAKVKGKRIMSIVRTEISKVSHLKCVECGNILEIDSKSKYSGEDQEPKIFSCKGENCGQEDKVVKFKDAKGWSDYCFYDTGIKSMEKYLEAAKDLDLVLVCDGERECWDFLSDGIDRCENLLIDYKLEQDKLEIEIVSK